MQRETNELYRDRCFDAEVMSDYTMWAGLGDTAAAGSSSHRGCTFGLWMNRTHFLSASYQLISCKPQFPRPSILPSLILSLLKNSPYVFSQLAPPVQF